MRFLHTSDWHLGKTLCNTSLIEDQSHALEELVFMIRDSKVEALVISGNIFDRTTPNPDSLRLLDDFLKRVIPHLQTSVIMITGNHDSPERLTFGADLLERQGLYVAGKINAPARVVPVGNCAFHLLPYADPQSAKAFFPSQAFPNHESVLKMQLESARKIHPEGFKFIAVAHASVKGSLSSESELDLGEGVDARLFEDLDYAALGHLHFPQDGAIHHYPGSLLKYAATESHHTKGVNLVTWDFEDRLQIEQMPFSPRRDLRRVTGSLHELLESPQGHTEDYLFFRLTDATPVPDAMNRLRAVYPNILGIENPGRIEKEVEILNSNPPVNAPEALKNQETEQLFSRFLKQSTGQDMNEAEAAIFREIVSQSLPVKGMQS